MRPVDPKRKKNPEKIKINNKLPALPKNKVKKIAIAARSSKIILKDPITPCGACRQVMTEYERIQDDKIEIREKY